MEGFKEKKNIDEDESKKVIFVSVKMLTPMMANE
jgi:hypothetical protein